VGQTLYSKTDLFVNVCLSLCMCDLFCCDHTSLTATSRPSTPQCPRCGAPTPIGGAEGSSSCGVVEQQRTEAARAARAAAAAAAQHQLPLIIQCSEHKEHATIATSCFPSTPGHSEEESASHFDLSRGFVSTASCCLRNRFQNNRWLESLGPAGRRWALASWQSTPWHTPTCWTTRPWGPGTTTHGGSSSSCPV
jgi:hypothetical protein